MANFARVNKTLGLLLTVALLILGIHDIVRVIIHINNLQIGPPTFVRAWRFAHCVALIIPAVCLWRMGARMAAGKGGRRWGYAHVITAYMAAIGLPVYGYLRIYPAYAPMFPDNLPLIIPPTVLHAALETALIALYPTAILIWLLRTKTKGSRQRVSVQSDPS